MVWFFRKHECSTVGLLGHIKGCGPIGIDISDDSVRMAQLSDNGDGVTLLAGAVKNRPDEVKSGTGIWQRWAIEAIREATSTGRFHGSEVVASMPASEVFIDHIKRPGNESSGDESKMREVILAKIRQKLPFEAADAMIKYIAAEENNAVVLAVDNKVVNRHLAIYENANLEIKSICVWPTALTTSYTRFFGRRKADLDAVVMLLETDSRRTNVVVCRHENLLFARTIPIGTQHLADEEMVTRLAVELTACRRQFCSMYKEAHLERLIFLSGQSLSKETCGQIAKQLEMPAQVGDCLVAVQIPDASKAQIDRRRPDANWATAFGLSLV